MCKTYEAIYKVAKMSDSDVVILWVGHKRILGVLTDCDEHKCVKDIVTLKDAIVECHHHEAGSDHIQEYKWLNIPAHHIKAFTFKCCIKSV